MGAGFSRPAYLDTLCWSLQQHESGGSRQRQQLLQVCGNRRRQFDGRTGERMRERNAPGMQGLAWKRILSRSVNCVSDDRPSTRGKVHANLVRPACYQLAAKQ